MPNHAPLTLIVQSSIFERVHYALATAAAAGALDRPTVMFFTQGAVRTVTGTATQPGWRGLHVGDPSLGGGDAATLDGSFRAKGTAGIEELLAACAEVGVEFLVCSMGMRVAGFDKTALRSDLPLRETGLTEVLSRGDTPIFV